MWYIGLAFAVSIIPYCIWNVFVRHPTRGVVAENTTIFMVQAPASFLAMTYIQIYFSCGAQTLVPRWGCDAIVVFALLMWVLMLPCIFARRAALAKAPVHTMSSFTFPSVQVQDHGSLLLDFHLSRSFVGVVVPSGVSFSVSFLLFGITIDG